MYIIGKVLLSAVVIGIVTEIARRFPTYGGIVAALPLVSLLSMIWLYVQGEPSAKLSQFALGVLWGFPATAVLLAIVYLSLKNSLHLFLAIGFGVGGWLLFMVVQEVVLKFIK
ncbi:MULTISPECIES: DUF3147 family protein [unclassified Bacillus (in: firmicutes)]|uniref:DUF3147 family protein n=1 Tax=unclassified Bacillus (in: firmicutes) TaxID=185979 RepID=UPI0008F04101|nr:MULTISPECIES: DUF3147 family protein [unclassified Bacillus (in: firmicutes)]SFA69773.1 hypothetical protein SAMN02799634_10153 [Bacillus sp. UNCCL13]SFQ59136.1 hypothetical protein SAMN04488577_0337 [Bacillus sp. cl95]